MTVTDVLAFRDELVGRDAAPKTLNRRISSLSSFYKYLSAAAAELRLPITVPNPAHAQFISRESTDPRDETRALTATRARQVMGMPAGDTVLDYRDRAILKFYLYSGARLSTGCRLKVSDFHQDGDEATIRLHEKGDKRRTIGLHYAAAQAIANISRTPALSAVPSFGRASTPAARSWPNLGYEPWTLWHAVESYLDAAPQRRQRDCGIPEATTARQCGLYTPHSLRATTATLLLDAGVDIIKVKDLLGHRHVTTTQIYDKRRRTTAESASHDVPI